MHENLIREKIVTLQKALATGQVDRALGAAMEWVMLQPGQASPRVVITGLAHQLGAFHNAHAQARIAAALDPSLPRPLDAICVLLADKEEACDSTRFGRAALHRAPQDGAVASNLATAFRSLGRHTIARKLLVRALALNGRNPTRRGEWLGALYNLGNLTNQTDAQISLRCFTHVLADEPAHHLAAGNAGLSLNRLGDVQAGFRLLLLCSALAPGYGTGLLNLANCYRDMKAFDRADRLYRRVQSLEPSLKAAAINRLDIALHAADLETQQGLRPEIIAMLDQGLRDGVDPGIAPLTLLHLPIERKKRRAHADLVARGLGQIHPRRPARPLSADGPLRVGYLSGDYRDHAIGHLMAGLFEAHDRTKVVPIAFSTGVNDNSAYRQRYENSAEVFHDVTSHSDQALFDLIETQEIDILVDVSGHTRFNRLPVLAARPAPITVHFLGYPGALGRGLVDWMIADPLLAAGDEAADPPYAILPDCYQVNDRAQTISAPPDRASCGLPRDGFVFASFVAAGKLSPETLALWRGVLQTVPNSVLWLLSPGEHGESSIRRFLAGQGVSPDRLVFAARMPKSVHLARHSLADLGLDSLIYGGHTTTSDALWAGLPVVTMMGTDFPDKVAASLLTAIGLPELITQSPGAFVALCADLASSPGRLAEVKSRLAANRLSEPLFDTKRFSDNLELAFGEMVRQVRAGNAPTTFRV